MRPQLLKLLQRVRDYNEQQPELKESYYFQFARFEAGGLPTYLLMGINPMESDEHGRHNRCSDCPLEESFERQVSVDRETGTNRWHRHIAGLLGTESYIESEWFFWSAKSFGELDQRYGPLIPSNANLDFCTQANIALINIIKPKAIISLGRMIRNQLACSYNLKFHRQQNDTKGNRLVEHFTYEDSYPWLVCPHPNERISGQGEKTRRRNETRDYISRVTP